MTKFQAALPVVVALALSSPAPALAQQGPPAPPPPPGAQPAPTDVTPPPVQPTSPPAGVAVAPPAPPPPTVSGQWVYTADYGWIWVPAYASTVSYGNVPYVYLYTPLSGWTWYVSPWGAGRYHPGDWVRHAWHSRSARTWVAPPAARVRLEPTRRAPAPPARARQPERPREQPRR